MKILIADDGLAFRRILCKHLEKAGHDVDSVENGQQAFHRATSHHYDLLISDYMMPQWDGPRCIEALGTICPELPVIVLSARSIRSLEESLDHHDNIIKIFTKPYKHNDLIDCVNSVKSSTYLQIQKLTRIVCTIGPASNQVDTLKSMILAGMDVTRLNFSHGTHVDHSKTLSNIREAEAHFERPIAVLQDLCGPKIRTGLMQEGGVALTKGNAIVIQQDVIEGTGERISTIAPEIIPDLQAGDSILLDDGLMELCVETPGEKEVICRIVVGGLLKSSKGMNLPATNLNLPSVTQKDLNDLEWGIANNVDFVALSFVRHASDIEIVKAVLDKHNSPIKVVAKIEKPEAVENIDAIIEVADAIMIARGDMGVEMRASRVPWIQKHIIERCAKFNKPVITATQMLESMTQNMRPTRAEVTDVTTAVVDGTDAVMLSGETAAGVDPLNVVKTMASIIREAETHPNYQRWQLPSTGQIDSPSEALFSCAKLANVTAMMIIDFSGSNIDSLAKSDRTTRTILVTDSPTLARHTCLMHSVMPVIIKRHDDFKTIVQSALTESRNQGLFKSGDLVAVIAKKGNQRDFQREGSLHLIRA